MLRNTNSDEPLELHRLSYTPPAGLIIQGRAAITRYWFCDLPDSRYSGSMHLCDFCWCREMAITLSHAHLATYLALLNGSSYRTIASICTTAAGSPALLLRYQPSPTRLAVRERPWGRGMCIDPFLKRPGVHMLATRGLITLYRIVRVLAA
jgi:hypothetical protein